MRNLLPTVCRAHDGVTANEDVARSGSEPFNKLRRGWRRRCALIEVVRPHSADLLRQFAVPLRRARRGGVDFEWAMVMTSAGRRCHGELLGRVQRPLRGSCVPRRKVPTAAGS